MTPSQLRYWSGWSSVWTAMRFSPGTSGMPFGTAHETATPSRSRRRSQCRRVAECSWTTNLSPAAAAAALPSSGSGVAPKSRLRRYSLSCSGVRVAVGRGSFSRDDFTALHDLICIAVGGAAQVLLGLLGEAVERCGVLAVLRVLAQQLLRLLEALLLAAAGLVDGLPRRVVLTFLWCLHAHSPTAAAGALLVRGLEGERGVDQRQMRERLR